MSLSREVAEPAADDATSAVAHLFDPLDESMSAVLHALAVHQRASLTVNGGPPAVRVVERFRDTALPQHGWELSRYVDLLRTEVVPGAVATASPRCLAHMTTPVPSAMAALSSLMVSLNQNLVRVDASASLSLVERQTLGMLHRLVYQRPARFYELHTHDSASTLGVVVSGGTLANVTAIWCARNAALPAHSVRELGLTDALDRAGHRGAVVIGPASMHYSFAKAADLVGIGTANLVRVPLDADDRIDVAALRRTVRRCREEGRLVLAVVAVAGTTDAGAVDPLPEVADVAAEARCHFHVDAAWGGPALMSPRQRRRFAGLSRADTVTLDGHKQFHLPVGAGFLLFRERTLAAHLEHDAPYTVRRGSGDLGLRSPEGSRPGTALLLHAALHLIGRAGYRELVDLGERQASYFADRVRRSPRFELLRDPQLNIVVYRYVPKSGRSSEVDALNVAIHRLQRRAGRALVSRTTISTGPTRQAVALRAVLANPVTTLADIDAVLAEQLRLGELVERGLIDGPHDAD